MSEKKSLVFLSSPKLYSQLALFWFAIAPQSLNNFVSSHQPQLAHKKKKIHTNERQVQSFHHRIVVRTRCQKRLPLINRWNEIMERWLHIQSIYIFLRDFALLFFMHKFIKNLILFRFFCWTEITSFSLTINSEIRSIFDELSSHEIFVLCPKICDTRHFSLKYIFFCTRFMADSSLITTS